MARKVLILGGGLSGLVAGWTLLSQAPPGALKVTILERGHLFGGKASSMPHTLGETTYEIDHGLHVLFQYPNLLRLLAEIAPASLERLPQQDIGARARVDDRTFVPLSPWRLPAPLHLLGGARALLNVIGREAWFSLVGRARLPSISKNLLGLARLWLGALMLEPEALSAAERRRLDELSFDAFAEQLGVGPALRHNDLFLAAPDSMFSPLASTFSILRALRLTQQSAEAQRLRQIDGPCGEVLIDPIRKAFLEAGGQLAKFSPVRRLVIQGHRVESVEIEERPRFPHARESQSGESYYHSTVREGKTRPEHEQADFYISALPPKALSRVLDQVPDPGAGESEDELAQFYRSIRRLGNHATTKTMACQIYYDRLVTPPALESMVIGTGSVFSAVIDRGRTWTKPDVQAGSARTSILEFVGTDAQLEDDQIAQHARQLAEQMFPEAASANIVKLWFHRSNHDEYFAVLPGTDADRPSARTPVENLWLAGDYTAHGFGNVGMEGAVVSGMEAANEVLRACLHPARQTLPLAPPGRLVKWLRSLLEYTGTHRLVTGYDQQV